MDLSETIYRRIAAAHAAAGLDEDSLHAAALAAFADASPALQAHAARRLAPRGRRYGFAAWSVAWFTTLPLAAQRELSAALLTTLAAVLVIDDADVGLDVPAAEAAQDRYLLRWERACAAHGWHLDFRALVARWRAPALPELPGGAAAMAVAKNPFYPFVAAVYTAGDSAAIRAAEGLTIATVILDGEDAIEDRLDTALAELDRALAHAPRRGHGAVPFKLYLLGLRDSVAEQRATWRTPLALAG